VIVKTGQRDQPIRVVVIDDTPAVRELLVTILQNAPGIQVVGVGNDGLDAIRLTKRLRPDVVTMDVVMPRMDGLEATRHVMRDAPTRIVIVTAGLMRAEEDLTFLALSAGALTVIGRPGASDPETCDKVVETVRLMAEVPVVHHWGRREQKAAEPLAKLPPPAPLFEEDDDGAHVQMIGIAASTGGPGTLATIFGPLPADFPTPILVVQHITKGFATGLAEWLNSSTPLRVRLAGHGERPDAGEVLLAPDDYHLKVNARGILELSKEEPYRGLRPSANYLFRSLAQAYGPRAVGVVLTGMGDDGAEGLDALHRAGGLTVAQDEESCVVYGMPKEATERGVVDRVLSPPQIAMTMSQLAKQQKRVSHE
jgi:two-component system chemotaxis response regulator CheB